MTHPKDSDPRPEGEGEERRSRNFVEVEIDRDLESGRYPTVRTRFPPEPNGYLHVGHAKALCADFDLAERSGGLCNLRFDDTNPSKEETEYVEAIQDDIRWLGYDWGDRLFFASDFFEDLYGYAEHLVREGHAYVDDQPVDVIREGRGGPGRPGTPSPYRDRSPEENLDLLRRMRAGEFEEGSRVLRARIDMAHDNLLMRDPVLYRILRAPHHRTGDAWCLYPTYDMAHGQCDALEGVTHSLCSLEFVNHRPLYEWLLERLPVPHRPRQIEFARLFLSHTILSKRKLIALVQGGHVSGWDDPRMPTLRGMRRRGYTPEAVRAFCARIGLAKANSLVELGWLEDALREDLNRRALRRMAVLRPLAVELTNLPEGERLAVEAVDNPEDPAAGTRTLHVTRNLFLERDDFLEDAPKKFFRLRPDGQVRLRYGFVIHCHEVVKDDAGEVVLLRCTYDPETGGGRTPEGQKKVKGIVHWVSADDAVPAEVRLYEPLFRTAEPGEATGDFLDDLNPDSVEVLADARLEPSLAAAAPGEVFQFERLGYFAADLDTAPGAPVFNRAVTLRDTWAKVKGQG